MEEPVVWTEGSQLGFAGFSDNQPFIHSSISSLQTLLINILYFLILASDLKPLFIFVT